RRLVDDQQMLVLEHDLERDVLRLIVRWNGIGNCDMELLAAAHLGCRVADRLARCLDGAASDQRFQALARHCRNGIGERTVEAPARVRGLQANVDRLMGPHVKIYGFATVAVQWWP